MSNPANPLDVFSTYQYHFILLVAASTEAYRQLEVKFEDPNFFFKMQQLDSGEKLNLLENTSTKKDKSKGETVSASKEASIYCVCNTNVSGQFNIDDVSIVNYPIEGAGPGTFISGQEITFTITEPAGIFFLNFIKNMYDKKLGAGPNSAIWCLIPYFVGYNSTRALQADRYQRNRPFYLQMKDTSAQFDLSGGIYKLSFVDVSNGVATGDPVYGMINKSIAVKADGNLLKNAVKSLEAGLNRQNKETFDALVKQNNGAKPPGRLVEYRINIPQSWESFHLESFSSDIVTDMLKTKASENTVAGQTQTATPTSAQKTEGATYVNTNIAVQVDQILAEIIKRCVELNQRFAEQQEKVNKNNYDNLRIYKTVNRITSDDNTICVHYDIIDVLYLPPEANSNPTANTAADKIQEGSTVNNKMINNMYVDPITGRVKLKPQPQYSSMYEFDYIFSGENIDILEFAMNMTSTIVYLSQEIVDNAKLVMTQDKEINNDYSNEAEDSENNSSVPRRRKNDPIIAPRASLNDKHGNQDFKTDQGSYNRQAMYNALRTYIGQANSSTINAMMTIKGNPCFLNSSAADMYPHDETEYQAKLRAEEAALNKQTLTAKEQYQMNGLSLPLICRVNVYYPDPVTGGMEKFWYSGFYIVKSISHTFIGGEFQQVLELAAYCAGQDLDFEVLKALEDKKQLEKQKTTNTPRIK